MAYESAYRDDMARRIAATPKFQSLDPETQNRVMQDLDRDFAPAPQQASQQASQQVAQQAPRQEPAFAPAPEAKPAPGRTFMGTLQDIGATAANSVLNARDAIVGVGDTVTGGRAGRAAELVGLQQVYDDPRQAEAALQEIEQARAAGKPLFEDRAEYSEAQKAAQARASAGKGVLGTVKSYVQNPSTILTGIGESIGTMGLAALTGGMAAAPGTGAIIGEGLLGAGAFAEERRRKSADGSLSAKDAVLSGLVGAGTMGMSAAGRRLATKIGLEDIDETLAAAVAKKGMPAPAAGPLANASRPARIAAGMGVEGVVEEGTQSGIERMAGNVAEGKPLMDGVPEAIGQGIAIGAPFGAVANAGKADAQSNADQPKADPGALARNKAAAQLRRALLDPEDPTDIGSLVALRNSEESLAETGLGRPHVDAIILEQFEGIPNAVPVVRSALQAGMSPDFISGLQAGVPDAEWRNQEGKAKLRNQSAQDVLNKDIDAAMAEYWAGMQAPGTPPLTPEQVHAMELERQANLESLEANTVGGPVTPDSSILAKSDQPLTEAQARAERQASLNEVFAGDLPPTPQERKVTEEESVLAKTAPTPAQEQAERQAMYNEVFGGDLTTPKAAEQGRVQAEQKAAQDKRLAELEQKAQGVQDFEVVGEDGTARVTPGQAPQDLTPLEEQEYRRLRAAQSPEDAQTIAREDFARRRVAELEQKAKGTEDYEVMGEDGVTRVAPGRPAEYLTDKEKQELQTLQSFLSKPSPINPLQGRTSNNTPNASAPASAPRGVTSKTPTAAPAASPAPATDAAAPAARVSKDSKAYKDFAAKARKTLGKSRSQAVMALVDARAKSAGLTPEQYVNSRGLELVPDSKAGTAAQRQDNKGAFDLPTWMKERRAIIHAFESADVSTLAHELAHLFRQDLAAAGNAEMLQLAEKWAGVKDGRWTQAQEEKFARGFERYLRDGKAPNEGMAGVFANFKRWLTDIYKALKGSPINIKLTPEIRQVFDALLTEEGVRDGQTKQAGQDTGEGMLKQAKGQPRDYSLVLEKEDRKVNKVGSVSTEEKTAVEADAAKFGLSKKETTELLKIIRDTKKRHPASDGWVVPVAVGIELGKPNAQGDRKVKVKWKNEPYTFHMPPGSTRAPGKVDPVWRDKMVGALTKEIQDVYARAEAGDKNAQVIVGHARWYRAVTEILRRDYGAAGDLLADLLGGTSPNTTVSINWKFAIDILQGYSEGRFEAQMRDFVAHIDAGKSPTTFPDAKKIRQLSGALYGMNSIHAMKALADTWRIIEPKTAPKARNFALNLIGQSAMATIDVWAARALQRMANLLSSGKYLRAAPVSENGVSGNWNVDATKVGGAYGFGAEVLDLTSKKLEADGIFLTAPDLQAVLWFIEKELWGKNQWTTKDGEGGSFEEQIAKNPMERWMAGWSIQQGSEVPDTGKVSAAQATVLTVLRKDPAIIAARALPTKGLYAGEEELSFDTELTAKAGEFDPSVLMSVISSIAKEEQQYDIFTSKVLRPDEDSPNARPGIEIYFRSKKGLDEARPILDRVTARGADGFTMAVDPRHEGQEQYIGIRLQYVPEIAMRWDEGLRERLLAPGGIEAEIASKTELLGDIIEEIAQLDGVAHAARYAYDTVVVGKENYDEYIVGEPAEGDSPTGGKVWFGQPIRQALEAAARRYSAQPREDGGGSVQDAGREAATEGTGLLFQSGPGDQRLAGDRDAQGSARANVNGLPVREDGRVSLVHFSRQEGLQELDPAKHGTGIAGAESRRKQNDPGNWVDRTYFAIEGGGYRKEVGLGPHRYNASLNPEQLYNAVEDPDGFMAKARGIRQADPFVDTTSVFERLIRDAGYQGYFSNRMGLVAAVFEKTKPESYQNQPEQGLLFQPSLKLGKVDVKSDGFKRWFGDWQDPNAFSSRRAGAPVSMVVNEDGTPQTVFHTTRTPGFSVFEVGRDTTNTTTFGPEDTRRWAVFTTPDSTFSAEYGGEKGAATLPLYISIKSPLDLTKGITETIERDLEREGVNIRWMNNVQNSWELFDGEDGKLFVEAVQRAGYDGAIIEEESSDGRMVKVFATFSPTQIKSALSNTGEFSDTNPNMLFQEGGRLTAKEALGDGGVRRLEYRDVDGQRIGTARILGSTIGSIDVAKKYRRQGYGKEITRDLIRRGGRSAYAGSDAGAELLQKAGFRAEGGGRYVLPNQPRPLFDDPRIKPVDPDSPALRRWLGNSQVTTPVHHGSPESFWTFDKGRAGSNTSQPRAGLGFFFTEDQTEAAAHAGVGGVNRAFYVKLEKPRRMPAHKLPRFRNVEEAQAYAKRQQLSGYDGIILEDEGHIIVFEPTQVKSAEFNTGEFSNTNPNMLFQGDANAADALWDVPGKDSLRDAAMFNIVDKLNPLKRVQDRITQAMGKIPDHLNTLLHERLRISKSQQIIDKYHRDKVDPLIKEMKKQGVGLETVESLVYANHAEEANLRLRQVHARRNLEALIAARKGPEKADLKAKLAALDQQLAGVDGLTVQARQQEYLDLLESSWSQTPTRREVDLRKRWQRFSEKPSGMSDAEAQKIKRTHARNKPLQDLARQVQQLTEDKVDVLLDAGLITDKEAAAWRQYEAYVPLKREGYEDARQPRGKGLSVMGKASRIRQGSTLRATNIFANIIADYEAAVVRAGKAKSAKVLKAMVEEYPNPEFWSIRTSSMEPYFDDDGNIRLYPSGNAKDNEVPVKIDGKRYIISFEGETGLRLAKALKNDMYEHGPAINALAKGVRLLAQLNTSWSPEFVISNMFRDVQTAAFNMGDTELKDAQLKVIKDWRKALTGINAAMKGDLTGEWAKVWEQYRDNGGKVTWLSGYDTTEKSAKALQRRIDMELKDDAKHMSMRRIKGALEGVERWNTAVENAVRLSFFKHAVEHGMTPQQAALAAKELTTNFETRGAYGTLLNSLYMFANAGIQGTARLLKAATTSKKTQAMMLGALGVSVAMDLINRSIGGDDDDGEAYYDKIPSFIKERNMIFMNPFSNSGQYVKVPLPWGYNTLWVLGSEIGSGITKPDYSPLEGAGRLVVSALNAFNPLQSATLGQTLAPTLLDPVVQVETNTSAFGTPLRPESLPFDKVPTPDHQQFWRSARPMSKWMAKALSDLTLGDDVEGGAIDISPAAIDVYLNTLTGSAGRFIADAVGTPVKALMGEDVAAKEVPFARRVYGTQDEHVDASNYINRTKEILTLAEKLKSPGISDEAKARIRKDPKSRLIALAKMSDSELRGLRKQKRQSEDPERIKKIDARIAKVYTRFNTKYLGTLE